MGLVYGYFILVVLGAIIQNTTGDVELFIYLVIMCAVFMWFVSLFGDKK